MRTIARGYDPVDLVCPLGRGIMSSHYDLSLFGSQDELLIPDEIPVLELDAMVEQHYPNISPGNGGFENAQADLERVGSFAEASPIMRRYHCGLSSGLETVQSVSERTDAEGRSVPFSGSETAQSSVESAGFLAEASLIVQRRHPDLSPFEDVASFLERTDPEYCSVPFSGFETAQSSLEGVGSHAKLGATTERHCPNLLLDGCLPDEAFPEVSSPARPATCSALRPITRPGENPLTPPVPASEGTSIGQPCPDGADDAGRSSDSETASPYSDDETDCGGDSLAEGFEWGGLHRCDDGGEVGTGSILHLKTRALVDRVMAEFHTLFEASWAARMTSRAGSENCSPPNSAPAVGRTSESSSSPSGGGKRGMADREADNDENEGDCPKRQRPNPPLRDTGTDALKLACPFHKRNPQKYGIDHLTGSATYRACSGPGWDTVARMKRHRAPIQCTRCCSTFNHQSELDGHVRDINRCDLRPQEPVEGITAEIEKRLRSRKKSSPDQDEESKWKAIYGIIFPGEPIPTAFYETTEDFARSPTSNEISSYEAFSRRELPRLVRRQLEAAVENEVQPIEEELKARLVEIVRDCQASVFLMYRDQRQTLLPAPTRNAERLSATATGDDLPLLNPRTEPPIQADGAPGDAAAGVLTPLYQHGLPEDVGAACPDLQQTRQAQTRPQNAGQAEFSDSGYHSLVSAYRCSDIRHGYATRSSVAAGNVADNPSTYQVNESNSSSLRNNSPYTPTEESAPRNAARPFGDEGIPNVPEFDLSAFEVTDFSVSFTDFPSAAIGETNARNVSTYHTGEGNPGSSGRNRPRTLVGENTAHNVGRFYDEDLLSSNLDFAFAEALDSCFNFESLLENPFSPGKQ
ncbi:hypothetical protein FGG08_000449 [Glutinoglossum americanum]|uniref:C2H2-type domain-containing protein n=1 Tax=Glutinoglossum americanum TaxID=1670608 RepID=A0A9P8IDA9_9PEZI|nr:hypothetical protein FGG08_000449 [Glutinoglossum americanum]